MLSFCHSLIIDAVEHNYSLVGKSPKLIRYISTVSQDCKVLWQINLHCKYHATGKGLYTSEPNASHITANMGSLVLLSGEDADGERGRYLYSLSCRISTGSSPWGFWMGVIRFCFCCIWRMGDGCPRAGWAAEGPGMGPGGSNGGWIGARDGRPLANGARSFWGLQDESLLRPGETKDAEI